MRTTGRGICETSLSSKICRDRLALRQGRQSFTLINRCVVSVFVFDFERQRCGVARSVAFDAVQHQGKRIPLVVERRRQVVRLHVPKRESHGETLLVFVNSVPNLGRDRFLFWHCRK